MKSGDQPSLYFSAYPLKALNQEYSAKTPGESPYLKAVLSGKTRSMSRVRVSPMINPYKLPTQLSTANKSKIADKLPTDIALTQKEWFNNYE